MNCEQYRALLNQQLDGEEIATGALANHAGQCVDCAALGSGAQRLVAALTQPHAELVPPRYLTRFIVLNLRDERRQRLALRLRLIASGMAAAVLCLVALPSFWPRPAPSSAVASVPSTAPALPPETTAPTEPPPTLRATVSQAGQAFGQLTARTADETVGQTRSLWPLPPALEAWESGPEFETSTQPLRETGQSAVVALEPVTTSARRAFGMLLHDLKPMDKPAKPES